MPHTCDKRAHFKIIDKFYRVDVDVFFLKKNIKIQKNKKHKKIFQQGNQKCKKK
jgi:hypothetical protein